MVVMHSGLSCGARRHAQCVFLISLLLLSDFTNSFVVRDIPKVILSSDLNKDVQQADLGIGDEDSTPVRLNLALYEKARNFGQSDEERKRVREILDKLNQHLYAAEEATDGPSLSRSDADTLLSPQLRHFALANDASNGGMQNDGAYRVDPVPPAAASKQIARDDSVRNNAGIIRLSNGLSRSDRNNTTTNRGVSKFRRKPQKYINYLKKKSIKSKYGRFVDDESPLLHSPEEGGPHFQGDIVLTAQQAEALWQGAIHGNDRRQKRKFINSPFRRWDPRLPIEFSFDGSHSPKEQKIIELAMEHWQNITCLNFERKNDEPHGNRIVFTDVDGCASNVGRHPLGEPQFVSIAPECMRLGVIAHEVAHALGFWHEQSRPDRDRFVTVVWGNIELGSAGQFTKETPDDVDDEGIDYDYGSIMHYRSKAFARTDDLFTIETNVRDYQRTIGQRDQLSFNDIKLMNKVYCSNSCPQQLPCLRGGYTDPRKCDICRCPDGFTGKLCDEIMPGFALTGVSCGGTVEIGTDPFQFSSPSYPGLFKEGTECSWLFRAPEGQHVALQFSGTFDLYCKAKHSLCMDYIEVRNSTDFANTGMRYCCYNAPPNIIYSATNEMLVLFRSFYRSGRGFRATAWAVDANGSFGPWSEWSTCTASCGGCGSQSRKRSCAPPSGVCQGESLQTRPCNTNPCSSCTETRPVVVPCGLWGLFRCEKLTQVYVPCKEPCCTGLALKGNTCVVRQL